MRKYNFYLNYHRDDLDANIIERFVIELEKIYGLDQVISFNNKLINLCDSYIIIISPSLLKHIDINILLNNLKNLKEKNYQLIIPLIYKNELELDDNYLNNVNTIINLLTEEKISCLYFDNYQNILKLIKDIVISYNQYLEKPISCFDYINNLQKFASTDFFINKDESITYNINEYHVDSIIIKYPLYYNSKDEDLYNEENINENDFLSGLFTNIFNEKENMIELSSKQGSGKTTLIKNIILRLIRNIIYNNNNSSNDNLVYPLYVNIPSFINSLRDNKTIYKSLINYFKITSYQLNYLFKNKKVLLIFDGIDYANSTIREKIFNFVKSLEVLDDKYFIFSSNKPITKAIRKYAIKPLNFEQKESLTEKILKQQELNINIDDLPDNPLEFCLDLSIYKKNNYIYEKSFQTIKDLINPLINQIKKDNQIKEESPIRMKYNNLPKIDNYYQQRKIDERSFLNNFDNFQEIKNEPRQLSTTDFRTGIRTNTNSNNFREWIPIGYYENGINYAVFDGKKHEFNLWGLHQKQNLELVLKIVQILKILKEKQAKISAI